MKIRKTAFSRYVGQRKKSSPAFAAEHEQATKEIGVLDDKHRLENAIDRMCAILVAWLNSDNPGNDIIQQVIDIGDHAVGRAPRD